MVSIYPTGTRVNRADHDRRPPTNEEESFVVSEAPAERSYVVKRAVGSQLRREHGSRSLYVLSDLSDECLSRREVLLVAESVDEPNTHALSVQILVCIEKMDLNGLVSASERRPRTYVAHSVVVDSVDLTANRVHTGRRVNETIRHRDVRRRKTDRSPSRITGNDHTVDLKRATQHPCRKRNAP